MLFSEKEKKKQPILGVLAILDDFLRKDLRGDGAKGGGIFHHPEERNDQLKSCFFGGRGLIHQNFEDSTSISNLIIKYYTNQLLISAHQVSSSSSS